MNFSYQKSSRNQGLKGFIVITVFLLLLAGLYSFSIQKHPEIVSFFSDSLTVWLLAIVCGILYWHSYQLYKEPGSWDISITNSVVIWDAPSASSENSFHIKVSDISRIVRAYSVLSEGSQDSGNSQAEYFIYLNEGRIIEIDFLESGINMKKFAKALKKTGIQYETEYRPVV